MELVVPDGWQLRSLHEGDSLVYEVVPAGPQFSRPSQARYRLEVRWKLAPGAAAGMARSFVETFRRGADTAQPIEEQTKGVTSAFSSVFKYAPAVSGAPGMTVAVLAIGNTRTGTLYKIRFDIPDDELALVAAQANDLFRTFRIDDEM